MSGCAISLSITPVGFRLLFLLAASLNGIHGFDIPPQTVPGVLNQCPYSGPLGCSTMHGDVGKSSIYGRYRSVSYRYYSVFASQLRLPESHLRVIFLFFLLFLHKLGLASCYLIEHDVDST